MVTPTGTKATVPVVQSSIPMPPTGAAVLTVTVPVMVDSDLTLVGLTETETSETAAEGLIVSDAVLLTPLEVAVIVTILVEPIGLVFTEKVAAALPAGTMIDAGTVAKVLLLDRVTVPAEDEPPETLEGLTETDAKVAVALGVTVRFAVLLKPA